MIYLQKESPMKISVLDQSYVIDEGTPELALEQTTELAQYVYEIGYHRYWVSEHHHSEALAGSSPEVLALKIRELQERYPIEELMAVSPIYDVSARKRSYALLKQAVDEASSGYTYS